MAKKRPYGYRVSSRRFPKPRYYSSLKDAVKEARRQIIRGASESGVSEVWDKYEWDAKKMLTRTERNKMKRLV